MPDEKSSLVVKHLTFFTSAFDTAEVGTGWHAKIVQQNYLGLSWSVRLTVPRLSKVKWLCDVAQELWQRLVEEETNGDRLQT